MWMWGQWGQGGKFREGERDVAEAQWKADISTQLREINGKVMEMALAFQTLSASIMTRKEIEDADNRRVLTETYISDQGAIKERITRLEGSAARVLPWVALAFSALLGIIGTAISVISLWHSLAH